MNAFEVRDYKVFWENTEDQGASIHFKLAPESPDYGNIPEILYLLGVELNEAYDETVIFAHASTDGNYSIDGLFDAIRYHPFYNKLVVRYEDREYTVIGYELDPHFDCIYLIGY